MVRSSLLLAAVLTGIGLPGCKPGEEEQAPPPAASVSELFSILAMEGADGVSGRLDQFLPPGARALKLGDSRAAVREERDRHYTGGAMEGPEGSLIELHGSGVGSYAERVRRGSLLPLDRLEVSFNGKNQVSGLRFNTEYGTVTREVILELSSLLGQIFGTPDHVFDLRQREIVGMQWVAGEGRVRLWFREPRGDRVTAHLQIEDPQEMMSDTAMNLDVALAKERPPKEVAAFLEPFLEEALGEDGQ